MVCTSKALLAILLGGPLLSACSTGLGQAEKPVPTPNNANVLTGLFLTPDGTELSSPILDHSIAGGVIPTPARPREVVFYAFATAAPSVEVGAGSFATNGASDIFVAAVVREDVNKDAFSYSIAGKMRHPRCINCHSVGLPDTWMYRAENGSYYGADTDGDGNSDHGMHGIPTGPDADSDFEDPPVCLPCHGHLVEPFNTALNDAHEELWFWPGENFDMRGENTFELALRIRSMKNDHLRFDGRVHWALEAGFTPGQEEFTDGIANGAPDDNHDGRDTSEDNDKLPRPVPGEVVLADGSIKESREVFFDQVDVFRTLVMPTDTREAISDVALVSRSLRVSFAEGDAGSRQPDVVYVPNPDFDGIAGIAGTVHVAYVSDASDLVAGGDDTNTFEDVFVSSLDVRVDGLFAGAISLEHRGSTLVSHLPESTFVGASGASRSPDMDASGRFIAFNSDAGDLATAELYQKNNGGDEADVFRWDRSSGLSTLVSRTSGGSGGNGDSRRPSISSDGDHVAFESDSILITPDSNGQTDVFLASFGGGAEVSALELSSLRDDGTQATGGDSRNPDVAVDGSGQVVVAFESSADLGEVTGAYDHENRDGNVGGDLVATNVYLRRTGTANPTTIVTQDTADANTGADGDSTRPKFGGRARYLMFETRARNLDDFFNRAGQSFVYQDGGALATEVIDVGDRNYFEDENYFPDVVLADLSEFLETESPVDIKFRGVSVSVDGEYGNGESVRPEFGQFATAHGSMPHSSEVGFAAFLTRSTNLGAADTEFTAFSIGKDVPIPDPPLRFKHSSPVLVWHAPIEWR